MENSLTLPRKTSARSVSKRINWKHFLRNEGTAYLFLLPFLIPFVVFQFGPALFGMVISFFQWSITGTPKPVGLENYATIFHDALFWNATKNTLYFMVLAVPTLIILSMALALLLNQRLRAVGLVRSLVVAPRVLMVSAVGIVWGWMFNVSFGLINYYLMKVGFPPIPWLGDVHWAMPAIVIATVWWTINGNVIIYLAGLQGIPAELYEAAKMDGANSWELLLHIVIPSLQPLNAFVIPMSVIAASRVFGQIYTMTSGGPVGKTFVIVYYIYTQAFQNFSMGTAAAAAVVLTAVSLLVTVIQLRAMRVS